MRRTPTADFDGSFGGFAGPIGYVARHYVTQLGADGAPALPSHAELPRGAVERVK